MWIQHIELLLIAVWPVVPLHAQVSAAQNVEQRIAQLERQVVELRRIHDLPVSAVIELPAELVGNEHVKWGYPGGTCAFLVREHYVACHDSSKRVPEWVTYHLTAENRRATRRRVGRAASVGIRVHELQGEYSEGWRLVGYS